MSSRSGGPLLQMTLWRFREFLREPEALFWVFAFPILLALALGIAFKSRGPATVRIAVEADSAAANLLAALDSAPGIEAVMLPSEEARDRLRKGRVALVVQAGEPVVYVFDSTRSEGNLARLIVDNAVQAAAGRRDVWEVREQPVDEPGSRYIDFLIPGLIGMNIMGTGMWGVGYGIVRQRTHKLLKRLLASPARKSQYMLSHLLARLVFLVFEVGAVLAFGCFAFGVPLRGSLVAVAVVAFLGAMTFAGIGLLVASRARTVEGVSGLMNLVMVPMWIFSGIFFAYTNFPEVLHPFIQALPLTALNDSLRAVILDGESLVAVIGLLAIVAGWGLGSFGVALRIFRWE
ncbi:MAG: ABC transporter permease [Gemmatimonadota bacterium]|nr:MAG: ABC transporter permease [Gemmatimonadota bacterium]